MAWMAIAQLVQQGVSTVFTALGTLRQGKAEAAAHRYQAAVARNNQVYANRAAREAEEKGQREEYVQRLKTKAMVGRQRTAFASNGVLVDRDTAALATADTAQFGELDALTLRDNASREAARFRAQGANYAAEAGLLDWKAKDAKESSKLAAFTTLLTGSAEVADKWYQYKKEGVFDSSSSTFSGSSSSPHYFGY